MRDPNRLTPLYAFIAKIHEENFPDLRIGQFLDNVASWYGADIFHIEDEKLYSIIPEYVKSLSTHAKFESGRRKKI